MEPGAELIVVGMVHTLDRARPRAEALLIRDGLFARVGSREECERAAGPGAELLELGQGCAVPGLCDAHGHAQLYGRSLVEVDLVSAQSEEECVTRVAERAAEVPRGSWIRGAGWDQTRWRVAAFPTLDALSAAVPEHPVALARVDVHALWVNGRALADCGVDRGTPDPPGGRILRRDGGAPAGVLIDNASALVTARIPPRRPEEVEELIRRGLRALSRLGLTGMHDAAASPEALEALARLAARGELPLRVTAMIDGQCPDERLDDQLARWKQGGAADPASLFSVRGVKLFADGALGSRGAALFEPYEDDAGNVGLWVTEPAELRRRILRLARLGVQPAVHCIGDRACYEVLGAFAEGARELGLSALRPRAEHLQLLRPEHAALLRRSGAVASMQPVHAVSDGRWAEERLGHRTPRQRGAYAWRQAVKAGAVLALGSDFPVESPDPRLGLAAAVLRTPAGASESWMPEQRLTLPEALRGFTAGAAFAEFAEERRGLVREGLQADLTLFARDLFALGPEELAGAPLLGTVVAGKLQRVEGGHPASRGA